MNWLKFILLEVQNNVLPLINHDLPSPNILSKYTPPAPPHQTRPPLPKIPPPNTSLLPPKEQSPLSKHTIPKRATLSPKTRPSLLLHHFIYTSLSMRNVRRNWNATLAFPVSNTLQSKSDMLQTLEHVDLAHKVQVRLLFWAVYSTLSVTSAFWLLYQ